MLFLNFDAENGNCEVGCWLEPAAAGRGLVTRAHAGPHRLGRRASAGIHRVEWYAASGNEPSLNVARRLGMTREGVLRESYPYRGVRHDLEVWSVLAPEWREARARAGRRHVRGAE